MASDNDTLLPRRASPMSSHVASDFFPKASIVQDGNFLHLDETDSIRPQTLAYCQNLHYVQKGIENLNVSAILTTPTLSKELIGANKAIIIHANPRFAFFELYKTFHDAGLSAPNIKPSIGQNCHISRTAYVSPNAVLGDRVEVGPNAVIEDFSVIANDVYIGPNAIIGAEGLLTLRHPDGRLLTVKHSGGVQIDDGSQILAGAVIAKSLYGAYTHIGKNCQIGILTNIGHGAHVGDNSVVSGNSVVAGRTKIGRNAWIGASAAIAQGLKIGDGAQIKMGAVVVENVECNHSVSGNFAISHKANMKIFLRSQRT